MKAKRQRDLLIPLLTVISDIVAIEGAFLFSYWLRFYSSFTQLFPVTSGFPPLEAYVEGSLVVIPVWLFLFNNRKMYRPRRIVYFSDDFFAVVRLVTIGMLIVMASTFFYRAFSYSRLVFGLIGLTAVSFISLGRFALLKFEQWYYSKGNDLQRVAVIGTNDIAKRISASLAANRMLGYEALGYFSANGKPAPGIKSLPHLGSFSSLPGKIKKRDIDVILIALNEKEYPLLRSLIRSCQGLDVEIMMVPDIVELMASQVRIKHLNGIPFLGIKSPALSAWNFIVKRAFDIACAATILVLTSPLFLLIAIAIKLDSKGPVFYLQDRVGLDGAVFKLIKFRSMRANAEKATGPVWSGKNDPRRTSIGRILRRFSFDELPQLINVLRGDMSLVGPRPERPYFVEQFKKSVPRYLDRHRVRAGMTGWAQVNGLRGDASVAERTKFDVYYVENWSLVFDIKIILKTVRAVLFGKDAY
jgi:exopolysaccharide biosynthesis polyprenyl glycosylphosphotransferase